jgi:hypothetical protein
VLALSAAVLAALVAGTLPTLRVVRTSIVNGLRMIG